MCGILFVHSRTKIPVEHHQQALSILSSRGPDFLNYRAIGNYFIAQTVLHITGDRDFYHENRSDFFAYNGEIYNYHRLGSFRTDTEVAYKAAAERPDKFKDFEGAWAWVYLKGNQYRYASDPQGERCLYRYQDDDILIVASEVAAILAYRDLGIKIEPYTEKHWPVHSATPWQGIERVPPGIMFDENGAGTKIDSIFDWAAPQHYSSIYEAAEDFSALFKSVIADMQPREPFGVTFSGGLDSALVLAELPHANHLYTVDVLGKDRISYLAHEFLTPNQQQRQVLIDLNEQDWAREFIEVVERTRMPVQSWSFVGQWCIAKHCQERVLFTGVGADELFGGYSVYQQLKFTIDASTSPYSCFDPGTASREVLDTWRSCLDFYGNDPGPATLLMDYLTQIAAVDMRGVDVCTSAHGIEPRSPFTHPSIIKFALNLPFKYRVGITPKPIIRKRFLETYNEDLVFPKQGFSGHCNDSYPWLDINVERNQNRQQDWKNIAQAGFIRWCNPAN
jgi:asparagine synthetase B (glutamine-hydrolysing)